MRKKSKWDIEHITFKGEKVSKNNEKSSIKIILSDQNLNSLQKYKKILKQILANQIKL